MAGAHKFAMLMLAQESADQIASREELEPVLERQLVALEQLGRKPLPQASQDDSLAAAEAVLLH